MDNEIIKEDINNEIIEEDINNEIENYDEVTMRNIDYNITKSIEKTEEKKEFNKSMELNNDNRYKHELNNFLLIHTTIAALLITCGVVIMNYIEQTSIVNNIYKMISILFFIGGWIYLAFILAKNREDFYKRVIAFTSLGIIISTISVKYFISEFKEPPLIFPALFALCWLILGYYNAESLDINHKLISILGATCILISIIISLQLKRNNCIVDGPGMPLFLLGWGIVIFINSKRMI